MAYLRLGAVQSAVDCCIALNQWDQAVELAEAHRLPEIEGLLSRYAARLLAKDDLIAAVELYQKAHKHLEAAELLVQLADKEVAAKVNPLRAKQLFVLAGLEGDEHRARRMAMGAADGGADSALARVNATLDGLSAASAEGAEVCVQQKTAHHRASSRPCAAA